MNWSATHYWSAVSVGALSVWPLRGSRCVQVPHQLSVLLMLSLVASDLASVVPPGRRPPRLPLQRPGILWHQGLRHHHAPPPVRHTAGLRNSRAAVNQRAGLRAPTARRVNKGAKAGRVRLLAGDFSGVIAPGSRPPRRPLQSLSFVRQLRHPYALLPVPVEEDRRGKVHLLELSLCSSEMKSVQLNR